MSFDTTENNRNNDLQVAKILSDSTDREQVQDLLAAYGPDAFLFDTTKAVNRTGPGGFAYFAQAETWPALNYKNADIGLVVTVLGPCGLNTMHTHRTTEMQINVGPGTIESMFIELNGLQVVNNTKPPGTVTIFPEGSIHMEMNTECVPTTFFSAFPDKDFGRIDMAQIVNFGSEILNATFFGLGTEGLLATGVDQGSVLRGPAECRQRCGLPDDYDFASMYPNLGYFTPDWFNTTTLYSSLNIPGAASNTQPPPSTNGSSTIARRHVKDLSTEETSAGSSIAHAYLTLSDNPLQPVVVGLTFSTVVLLAALLLALFGFGRRKSHYLEADKF
ncbi:hypothetical protein Clacol_008545 [Clathrus columnatus]|uniref:Cupin type-1 domain-containing protein n=1 Tax=Clathrus columnatus TaxID=1419009 RepID=A0AAV5AI13_9AGAM|nr:hypothetical protein Clacol_008545 [Clathrus columnatus]